MTNILTFEKFNRKLADRFIESNGRTTTRYYVGALELLKEPGDTVPRLVRANLPWGYMTPDGLVNAYIPDYQGNIRAVIDHTGNTVQTTDYYPYGLPMATSTGAEQNRYKYGGKELETRKGLNFHDFEARMLFNDRGLFNRPDPKAFKTPSVSPYVYCNGNPINMIDPSGMDTLTITYADDKWSISQPVIAKGDDVFIVKVGDTTEEYIFSEGEYGERVCALNLEIGETTDDATLGVYHVSGSSDAHGYYVTPGGEASTNNGSGCRIPEDVYPITTPIGVEKWRSPGVGGSVAERGIRFHYGKGDAVKWTKGCFVLSTDYFFNEAGHVAFKPEDSIAAYKTFGTALGATSFYSYGKSTRIGMKFESPIQSKLLLKSRY